MASVVNECENGVVVHQVTDGPALVDNIYCERSYCTPDSRYFVYQRRCGPGGDHPWKYEAEYIACEFGTWETRVLGRGVSYPEISQQGSLFYVKPDERGESHLARVDIATGETETIRVDGGVSPLTGMTVCPRERHLAYGVHLGDDPLIFGIELVDLQTGGKRVLFQHPEVCNPHAQFEPGDGRTILVQRNVGCRPDPQGEGRSWSSGSGATLLVVAVDDGSAAPLQVGPPHTALCSGHQQWIGASKRVLATLLPTKWTVGAEDTLVAAAVDAPPRVVSRDFWGHVHVARSGRYFLCDNGLTGDLSVGSIASGEHVLICNALPLNAKLVAEHGQRAHHHAYLSPDLRWTVFNACLNGKPEICAASLPPGLLGSLADGR